ncbi:hypothetical protein RchiOBHm_Chr3g0482601 [Rosa chinensis]|uniref:DUF7780 domain-containing protein n=1 Tax=Rosa chinensis TaxID=74649 RepID=A0A2P6REB6_ROSCH|nr:uncharacterized protein LOC112192894 [Rosa chinensis]PRQ44744.1 hypothetical protein RchiOBHm_Chr3g0482601 [Rosa chinensis]
MGFTAKPKSTTSSSPGSSGENWGMGLLLVFFPEDNTANAIVDKSNMLFSSSSSSSTTSSPSSSFKRSNSNNVLLSKAQSTISICALLVFITLLLFTLSTFEPNSKTHPFSTASRRFLSQNSPPANTKNNPDFKPSNVVYTNTNHSLLLSSSWFGKMWKQKKQKLLYPIRSNNQFALQRMGTLYRRGTKAMTDLVVGHVDVDVTESELRLFIRLLHRSGLTARADIIFIFASSTSSKFGSAIQEENESFLNLVRHYSQSNITSPQHKPTSGFDVTQFLKLGKKQTEEPLWGKRSMHSNSSEADAAESTRLSYGSVVGFEVGELDPENSLDGFLDHVAPMSLRRWACYPMLLGRVRRNFKHVMLVDVKNSVVLGDPLGRVRHKSAESVLLSTMSNKHCSKKNSDPAQSHCPVNSAVITGGARGIRRMSATVLTEIVRASMQQQRKRKSPVTESGVLSQLVGNEFISKNIKLVTSTESIPDPSSLAPGSLLSHAVIQRGNTNHDELYSIIMKQICSSEIDSSVYRDC